jgi:hypothetical protein
VDDAVKQPARGVWKFDPDTQAVIPVTRVDDEQPPVEKVSLPTPAPKLYTGFYP